MPRVAGAIVACHETRHLLGRAAPRLAALLIPMAACGGVSSDGEPGAADAGAADAQPDAGQVLSLSQAIEVDG
jgi:hypothetical protein